MATCTTHKNLVKFVCLERRVILQVMRAHGQANRQTDRHTNHNTLHPSQRGQLNIAGRAYKMLNFVTKEIQIKYTRVYY